MNPLKATTSRRNVCVWQHWVRLSTHVAAARNAQRKRFINKAMVSPSSYRAQRLRGLPRLALWAGENSVITILNEAEFLIKKTSFFYWELLLLHKELSLWLLATSELLANWTNHLNEPSEHEHQLLFISQVTLNANRFFCRCNTLCYPLLLNVYPLLSTECYPPNVTHWMLSTDAIRWMLLVECQAIDTSVVELRRAEPAT